MEDYGRAYWRNRRHILSVPNDYPMTPRPSFPPMREQPCDSPASPLAAETEKQAPSPVKLESRPTETVSHTPITNRSGHHLFLSEEMM